jgi:hypothetical protein
VSTSLGAGRLLIWSAQPIVRTTDGVTKPTRFSWPGSESMRAASSSRRVSGKVSPPPSSAWRFCKPAQQEGVRSVPPDHPRRVCGSMSRVVVNDRLGPMETRVLLGAFSTNTRAWLDPLVMGCTPRAVHG